MKYHPCFSLALLGITAFLSACTNVNTVERAQPLATPNYVDDKRVITDTSLAATVKVLSVNQSVVSDNLLKVQVMVTNTRSSARTFNYKFEWYDQNGMLVQSPTSVWKSMRIQPKETTAISAVGPNPTAVDFVLKLQEP